MNSETTTTHFECTQCGECCRGKQRVRLNPHDLDLLAQYLNSSVEDLYKDKVVGDFGEDPRPILVFKKWPIEQCRFLINTVDDDGQVRGLCELHPHFKPLVCHLAPVAREVTQLDGIETETWSIVEPSPECPGFGRGPEIVAEAPIELVDRLSAEAQFMRLKLNAGKNTKSVG